MKKIFVVPADAAHERHQLDRSILNAVDRQRVIGHFSDATYPELIEIERRGRGFYAWGVPAEPGQIDAWFHMGVGDGVLIAYRGAYRHYARVLGRYENGRAAQAIWGGGDAGGHAAPRPFLFFVTEPIPLTLSFEAVGDYLPTGFERLTEIPPGTLARIEADFGTVDRFIRRRLLTTNAGGPVLDMSGIIQVSERDQAQLRSFEAGSSKEARARVVDSIIRRRGHPAFRKRLLAAYDFRCAITGCDAADTLEAAYIIPFRGEYTHQASNGLLLRADVHTLFDLGKIAVDTRSMTVVIADELLDTSFRILAGRPLRYPQNAEHRPSTESLDIHRRLAGL